MSNIKCISLIIFVWAINIFAQQTSPLTFSEIMFYPSETNGEFVEIYNTSSTETIDIANYKFKYYTSSNNNLIPLIGGTKLGPGKFAVILQGNYDFNNGIYKTLIPSDAIVLKVSSNNFGSSGMANTTSRTIYLIDPNGQTVDTYTYSADNSAGISDEKIILNKDNSSSNWKNSLRTHGTPGSKNSVSPTDYDLQIKFLNINPLTPRAEDSLKITFVVINKGRLTANNFSVSIFNDVNHDSIEQAEENIFYQDYSELINGDSIVIQKSFYAEIPGSYSFIASVNFLLDEVLTNNKTIANVTVAEKLTLYNDILPTLNNTGDAVVIKDEYNRTIDSTRYYLDWGGNNGKSLERKDVDLSSIDKDNWSSSTSKNNATPCKVNSISQKDYDVSVLSFFSKSKYAEVGKSLVLSAIIKNIGKEKAEKVEVQLFRDNNLIEKKEISAIESNQELQIEFMVENVTIGKNQFSLLINYLLDEYDENNTAFLSIDGVEIKVERGDIVINEIMYAPISPEPEWIELYNRSEKEIDIKNYQIGNEVSKNVVIKTSKVIKPKEYVTIAKDTNIYSIYSGLTNVVISNFPILNNNGGIIVISDSLGRTIDSVNYKSSWGGKGGKSLERIDAFLSSSDSANWKSSTIVKGGTPNKNNSVTKKNYDVAIVSYSILPEIPVIGKSVKLIIDAANYGKNLTNAVLIVDEMKDNVREKLKEVQINNFMPYENLKLEVDDFIPQLISKRKFEIILNLQNANELDEDTTNNSIIFTVYPSYFPNSVLINEIMYNPINGEPEWIEIFNTSNYDIDLEGWSITDVLTNPTKTKIKDGKVPKNSLTVISRDSSIINFHKIIPSQLIINQFANLNNDADGVVLKDAYDVTIDSLMYQKSWGGDNGKSLERKSLLISSLEKNNWGSSLDIELSTPGRLNSISRKANDIAIKKISTEPEYPGPGEEINLSVTVLNCGLNSAQNFTIQFYFQKENSYQFFDEVHGSNLSADDSITITSNKKLRLENDLIIYCKIYMDNDEDTLNNFLEKEIRLSNLQYSILINEIMYNPFEGESEWIEIVNVSNHSINLKNWYVSDLMPSPTKSLITKVDEYLQPGEYAVLTSDTAKFPYYTPKKFFQTKFGTLNNTFDGIIIYDFNGRMIDSVFYNSKWGYKKGYSIERISLAVSSTDSTNWLLSLSKDGATPGYENSINNISTYKKNSIVINEIMYEPDAGNSEFIEFFNATSDTIQIGGMNLIFGKNGKTKLSDTYLLIKPKSFFIIANDSSIYKNYSTLQSDDAVLINKSLSLSNDGCELILKDIRGNTIDSVYYLPDWHNKNLLITRNKSLERINPYLDSNDNTNWSTSVNKEGATPLKQNSIYTAVVNSESKVTISPNPFSPDNDGFEDFTTINFDLSFKISQVRIRVFDSQGRLVRTLTHSMPAASHNSIIFDGLDDKGRPLRIGIYILLIEITNENGNRELRCII